MEATLELTENWLARVSYTNLFEQPDLSYREVATSGSFLLNYQYGHWNWSVSGVYRGRSEFIIGSEDNTQPIDGDWQIYTKGIYTQSNALSFYLQIKNLFDERLQVAPDALTLAEPIPGRGLETTVGLNYRF